MGGSKLTCVFLATIVHFLLCEARTIISDHETFQNTVVQWCNDSSIHTRRFCEDTTISHSNALAENIPTDHRNLQYITISNQNIPILYENAISNMNIKSLEIGACNVTDIEAGVFTNTYFYSLNISYNRLETLRRGIFDNATIEGDIHLIGNGIKTIEEGIFKGMMLNSIDLSKNELEDIAPGVFQDVIVQLLSLGENKLKIIRREMFRNINMLQLLDLSNNQIKLIEPTSFEKIMSPAFVYLKNNLLETIPEGVFNTKVYMELLLDGNNIQTIMPGAFNGSGFGYLNLTGNNIQTIKCGMFDNNTETDNLIISNNNIRSIQPRALDNIHASVDLSSNNLTIIRKETFRSTSIIILLKNKKLKKIEVGSFSDDEITGSSYDRPPQTLYLENDNLLDQRSKNYLHNLTRSGNLIWYNKID